MKFDYLLRLQEKHKGDYTVYFDNYTYLQLPSLKLGTWKLTSEGRKRYKELLDIEVNVETYSWGQQVHFTLPSKELAIELAELLWLSNGVGALRLYEKFIEKTKG